MWPDLALQRTRPTRRFSYYHELVSAVRSAELGH
jgi:hypothetical protein